MLRFPHSGVGRAWILVAIIAVTSGLAACSGTSRTPQVVATATVNVRFVFGTSQDTAAAELAACRPELGVPTFKSSTVHGREILAARFNLVSRPDADQKSALIHCLNLARAVSSYTYHFSAAAHRGAHLV